jgi:ring-1,2-phenylacetyl-CoA epoxidase subunit PaaD
MQEVSYNAQNETARIRELLNAVHDPEVPVLSVNDLGIVRNINVLTSGKEVEIEITPTYSGCPAMDMIAMNIRIALMKAGYTEVKINKVLTPAWTTDWMSEAGKQKLKAYGISPPGHVRKSEEVELFAEAPAVECPLCFSLNTSLISEFGSTSCKSLYKCNDCQEPFDHFKCH